MIRRAALLCTLLAACQTSGAPVVATSGYSVTVDPAGGLHFLGRESRTSSVTPAGITDQPREIPDEEDHFVAELLEEVGPDGHVTGVDASPAMLALAARRCAGRAGAGFVAADVRSLPVAGAAFDAALCVQVLEYVPEATAALAGMHRVLRPGGRIVIWDVDWSTVSWHSADPDRMRRVLRTWSSKRRRSSSGWRWTPASGSRSTRVTSASAAPSRT